MFDEKSGKWIQIFKGYTKVMFWAYIAMGVVLFFAGLAGELYWIDGEFIDGIAGLLCGAFAAFVHLVVHMLIIQFLNNVQVIREKLEQM